MQKKAIIAMSGGVDSSVAAYLMVKEGYDCAGATLKLYDNPQCSFPGHRACCTPSDTEDARSVAARLGMLYYVFPMHDEFRHSVIDKFADTYLHGGTPNPCIDCNRFLKFSALLDKARELGCEYIASGHYARREQDPETGRFILKKGLDPTKDQSYVLYMLTQEQLAHTLFPLGSLHKTDTRAIADTAGLSSAHKPDSQDICFVPDGDYAAAIERLAGIKAPCGNFIDASGKVIGTHRGITHYTVGQHRGLGLSLPERRYVCSIDAENSTVTLGGSDELYSSTAEVRGFNWISGETPAEPIRCTAKIRYRQPEQPATAIAHSDGSVTLHFDAPQRAVTPGQAAVLYDGDTVLGGGEIVR